MKNINRTILQNHAVITLPALSAILFGWSTLYQFYVIGLICWVPISYIFIKHVHNKKALITANITFAIITGLWAFNWSYEAISWYTNGNTTIALLCYLVLLILYTAVNIIIALVYHFLARKSNSTLVHILCYSTIIALADWIMNKYATGLPWLQVSRAYSIVYQNDWLQLTRIGGTSFVVWILTIISYYNTKRKSFFLFPSFH